MIDNEMMLVPPYQETMARLIACRTDTHETLDGVLIRLTDEPRKVGSPQTRTR